MNEIQKKFIESPGRYLMHYNHNHDKLGRFARSMGIGGGGSSGSKTSKTSSDNDTSNAKSIYDYSGPEQSFLERDQRIIKLRQEQYEMTKIKNDTKRKKEALRINNEINRTAAEVIKDYTPPVESEAHYTGSKPLDFQKSSTVGESIAKIDYGKNPKCGVVIDGGSKQLANELVRDPKIEKMFREYAADSDYPYRLDEYKDTSYDDYKNSLVCQQITVHAPQDTGNYDNKKELYDVTCWYGEQPDGPGEMIYYDSKKKKIIGSDYYR